ncbi:MAG: DUF2167 domain-containing protein [Chitinophagaceae bacterium]
MKTLFAKEPADSLQALMKVLDSIESSFNYKTGKIDLGSNLASINVPQGFKYLDGQQSERVIYDLWKNPKNNDKVLGMIFPEKGGVISDNTWAFVITYDDMGYVKDKDADDINYDDMMKEMKSDAEKANPERIKQGYTSMHMIGWAEKPYYDKDKKVLYWAKEINFGEDSLNTLNYDVRVLGRKGVLSLNAVASIDQLQEVDKYKGQILAMVQFNSGNKYSDYDSGVDKVAAWTIGGLVAGKVLAKVGFFALILKNIKLVLIALAGAGSAIWRFITGRRKKKEELQYAPVSDNNETTPPIA